MNLSVIIPAYNEAERIGDVLDVVIKSDSVDEIIVVDDGSKDNTFVVAKRFPSVKVEYFGENRGKAYAMNRGVERSSYSNILFLDADLKGLKKEHIDKMIDKYEEGYEMVIGVFYKGRWSTDFSQKFISSHLSGQRLLTTEVWNNLDMDGIEGFGVEAKLSSLNLNTGKVRLTGLTHAKKEEKRGRLTGLKARLKMYFQITISYIKQFLSYFK